MKALQLEWNFNWNSLNEKRSAALPLPLENLNDHPSRHQRILRRHIVDLEKTSKHLRHANEDLQTKILKLEEEVHILQNSVRIDEDRKEYDRITGNQVDHYVNTHKINEISGDDNADVKEKLIYIEEQQRANTENLMNMTLQLTNFDKLHMSMLELLENVESLENKVNKNFPEFRKEISKLEVQMTETTSKVSALKEDQSNIRASMKAIGVSVSNMKDKYDEEHKKLNYVMEDVDILKTSDTLQNSKLHNHILKAESQTVELNATKSTIHLVQELKTFEKEYKNIINKLPYDCNLVSGPSGVYLISPGEGEPIMAHCDDGWTMIQKREDGSVNFNRNWNDYSNGFGSATGEHWLGNRHLHALTRDNCTKLQINMRDIYGKYWQANYDDFRVADYTMGFKLVVDRYSGNASDALDYQNRMEFSTVDNDRDISNTHCASNYEGGWWFSHCQHANLNGRYNLGLTWFDSSRNEWIAVSHSEMKIKRRTVC
ncbi:fibrinogen/tenascin/angiopoeitin [Holotrichia oblita]|uniref:Fibrinogen/tenascin/angiopoeitin n=1 Tax=Holotrichia oblita TaxID=644536 RepID=A0ACB9TX18_HOLOL|nr:fibrinogen/tenascin/angiopoeitin [Holotrichia oblita]